MNKIILSFIFVIVLCAPCLAQYNETLTIVTYYPSPNGVYRVLRLNPGPQPGAGVAGDMYYDEGDNLIKFHNDTMWVNMTGGGGGDYWSPVLGTADIFNTNMSGRVSVGTTAPIGKFTVNTTADFDGIFLVNNSAAYVAKLGLFAGYGECVLKNSASLTNVYLNGGGVNSYIRNGNLGIGTTNPQQMLDVNGPMRLAPGAVPPGVPSAGSIYYDNAKDTLRYRDASAPAQWMNFISEYGTVTVPASQSTYTVTFRKVYASAPIVIATPVGTAEDMVMVRNYRLTNTYVEFDIDAISGGGTHLDSSTSPQQIQYIVIPQ